MRYPWYLVSRLVFPGARLAGLTRRLCRGENTVGLSPKPPFTNPVT